MDMEGVIDEMTPLLGMKTEMSNFYQSIADKRKEARVQSGGKHRGSLLPHR